MLEITQLTGAIDFNNMEKSTMEVNGYHQLFGYHNCFCYPHNCYVYAW